jgi:hypothetical protein
MMRSLAGSTLLLMSLMLGSCATSRTSKNSGHHKKSFKTPLVQANFSYQTGGLGDDIPIFYQVQSTCKDTGCAKPKIVLSFSLEPGPNDIFLNRFNLTIHAGDKDYHWEGENWRIMRKAPPVRGRFFSVHLTKDQLKHIAESKQVKGNLADNAFHWSYKNRDPLRSLLAKLKQE